MATKNLKYFMRPELKEEQIVEVPGPIKDENGEPIMFQIKKLSQRHIDKIYDRHKVIRNALDKKVKFSTGSAQPAWNKKTQKTQ